MRPIDITSIEISDEENDDDDFEEIFLKAAPCSVCNMTVSFADDAYNRHIKDCLSTSASPLEPAVYLN